MASPKTTTNKLSADEFLNAVTPPSRNDDARQVCEIMARISGEVPVMWGSSIVGFGTHHYRYASGREGDICKIGFSPRKAATVLYLTCDLDRVQPILERLGKYDRGVGCLYLKRLADADKAVLEELITTAWNDR